MHENHLRYITRQFEEYGAGQQVGRYIDLFPMLDSRLAKFAPGILLWARSGLIDIDNPDDVSRISIMLRVLDQTPGFDFFDNVFNEADPDTVCAIIGIVPTTPEEDEKIEYDYSVTEIKDFEDAHSYFEEVAWCIVISEESFNDYTATGNRFYFCGNGDWRALPCIPGRCFPRDRYGYSLIAVEVTPDNRISSVTSRWNTSAQDNGQFLSSEELRKILGETNFNKLFNIVKASI